MIADGYELHRDDRFTGHKKHVYILAHTVCFIEIYIPLISFG